MPRRRFASILITGASSGIGAALARAYAAPGVSLALTGRDEARLATIANACRGAGSMVRTAVLDVADEPTMARQLVQWDEDRPFDLVIANAGIGTMAKLPAGGGWDEPVRAITATNVAGTINTLAPLLPRLLARRSGQIALMSSLAGFIGLPPAPAYGASKAWIRLYGEALRGALADQGVGVSVICPGFVATPMIAGNRHAMPFLVDSDRAAAIIMRGIAANRGRIVFPWPLALLLRLLGMLPYRWREVVIRHLSHAPADAPAAR